MLYTYIIQQADVKGRFRGGIPLADYLPNMLKPLHKTSYGSAHLEPLAFGRWRQEDSNFRVTLLMQQMPGQPELHKTMSQTNNNEEQNPVSQHSNVISTEELRLIDIVQSSDVFHFTSLCLFQQRVTELTRFK